MIKMNTYFLILKKGILYSFVTPYNRSIPITLVFLINVQAHLFFGGSISPLHTHFYLVPARLLGTTYILIRPTLPISRLHAYLCLHVY